MDNLVEIIKIRDRKFKALKAAENAQLQSLNAAGEKLKTARQNMLDHADEVKNLETEMLSELVGKELDKSDLLMVEHILERAKQKAELLLQQFNTAEQELNACTDQLQSVRTHRVEMQQRLNRIQEVNVEYQKEARKANKAIVEAAEVETAEAAYINRRSF